MPQYYLLPISFAFVMVGLVLMFLICVTIGQIFTNRRDIAAIKDHLGFKSGGPLNKLERKKGKNKQ